MKKTSLVIGLLFVALTIATGTAAAQPAEFNESGVTMGHWHIASKDVEANKKLFLAMGGKLFMPAGNPVIIAHRGRRYGVLVRIELSFASLYELSPNGIGTAGGVLGPWTAVTIAGPRKTIITGLTMAGIYHFQIRAFGKLGVTPIGWTAKRSSAPNSPVHWAAVPGNRDCRLFLI